MSKKIERLIKKYTRYRENLLWHIRTNGPKGEERTACDIKIISYMEIVSDLNKLLNPLPSTKGDDRVK